MGNALDYSKWKEEKINGEIYYMSPSANPKHSRLLGNLYLIFRNYLKGKTCEVFMDNLDVHLDETLNNYIVPDMSILCDSTRFKEDGYYGVPKLIVEVLSPTSIKRDRFEKFKLYEHFGVHEYWLVDYQSQSIEQYTLIDGTYQLYNLFTLISDWDYENRLSEKERLTYTTIIKPTIFNDLEIDIKDIFN